MPSSRHSHRKQKAKRKIRYAIVGLGHISQAAALPAFQHARNSEITALVSGDPTKLRMLCRKYKADGYSYEEYDECLRSGKVDAVYIGLPNDMHCDYTIAAAEAGAHVLCEKPLAATVNECHRMIEAAKRHRVKLMTAYRLHHEAANLCAIETIRSGKIGKPRIFNSVFTMDVKDGDNIRLSAKHGGGPLYDIGTYCINAARNVFRSEPTEVFALAANNGQRRFEEVHEMVSAILRFPEERLASFVCSFGAADVSFYRVVGTKGNLVVSPAYDYTEDLKHELTVGEKKREKVFPKRDQFAAELVYFSDCILNNRQPEPSGLEGLADARIITALHESIRTRRPVRLEPFTKKQRPSIEQEIHLPPIEHPEEIRVNSPREKS